MTEVFRGYMQDEALPKSRPVLASITSFALSTISAVFTAILAFIAARYLPAQPIVAIALMTLLNAALVFGLARFALGLTNNVRFAEWPAAAPPVLIYGGLLTYNINSYLSDWRAEEAANFHLAVGILSAPILTAILAAILARFTSDR